MLPGLSGPIGRNGLEEAAGFLTSRGQTMVHPEPVPISLPLPEDFSYIP